MNSDTQPTTGQSEEDETHVYIYDLGKPQGHASLLQVEVSKTLNAQNSTCAEKNTGPCYFHYNLIFSCFNYVNVKSDARKVSVDPNRSNGSETSLLTIGCNGYS